MTARFLLLLLLLRVFIVGRCGLLGELLVSEAHLDIITFRLLNAEELLEASLTGWFVLHLTFHTVVLAEEDSLGAILLITLFPLSHDRLQTLQCDWVQLALGDLFCRLIIEL